MKQYTLSGPLLLSQPMILNTEVWSLMQTEPLLTAALTRWAGLAAFTTLDLVLSEYIFSSTGLVFKI